MALSMMGQYTHPRCSHASPVQEASPPPRGAPLRSGPVPAAGELDVTVISLTEGGGGALCAAFLLDGLPFRAIIDTGSPFLIVPAETDCSAQPRRQAFFGCAPSSAFRETSIAPSIELYGVTEAQIQWRTAELVGLAAESPCDMIIGAAPRSLIEASGGAFAGLILNGDGEHPTLLSQLQPSICGFSLDGVNLELLLYRSHRSGVHPEGSAPYSHLPVVVPYHHRTLPLVDLRQVGDTVDHIAVAATRLSIDGIEVPVNRPLVVVFDSGLTGILLSDRICEAAPKETSRARLSSARSIEVDVVAEGQNSQTFRASQDTSSSPFRISSQPVPWFPDPAVEPGIVVLGQAFLRQKRLVVDFNHRRALCEMSDAFLDVDII